MKRSILLLIPLMLGLASCNNSSSIKNKELVDTVKELLSKQDLSEFYTKTVEGTYSQEYDVLDLERDEDERGSSYFNYSGSGLFGYYYDLSSDDYNSIVDEKGNIDTFDAISKGNGYYGLVNLARTMSFNRADGLEAEIHNLDILQSTTLKTTVEDVWVDNSLYLSDTGAFDYESRQTLSASINRELLFSSISTRTFREIFSQIDLFDTPGHVEHLDKLFFNVCRDLLTKSDKEISEFISKNQVSIEENEDGDILLNFVFTNEDVDEDEEDYIFPGAVKGTLTFDKDTLEFSNFNYVIQNDIETYDEDTGSTKLISTKFTCEGTSTRELPHDEWEPTDPKVYDDVSEFLKDLDEQVVPPVDFHL